VNSAFNNVGGKPAPNNLTRHIITLPTVGDRWRSLNDRFTLVALIMLALLKVEN
jgi:hypothetical protein